MLLLKIIAGVLMLTIMLLVLWILRAIAVTSLFDNEQCRQCPMKKQCFNALSIGFPALCNTSDLLKTEN